LHLHLPHSVSVLLDPSKIERRDEQYSMSDLTPFRQPRNGGFPNGNNNDEWWWEGWVLPASRNDSLDELGTFFNGCANRFFEEEMDKADFFEVCCLVWTVKFLGDHPDTNPRRLWGQLKRAYITGLQPPRQEQPCDGEGEEETSGIVQWILPCAETMNVGQLEAEVDGYFYAAHNVDDIILDDRKCIAYMMEFWKRLYDATSPGGPSASSAEMNHGTNDGGDCPVRRPVKLRRTGFSRFQSCGASDLLQGKYKLPATYLLVSVLKEHAESWDMLRALSHQLPTNAFKTFSEGDIQAGLALVGLQAVSVATKYYPTENFNSDAALQGLSSSRLVREYFWHTE
jgi:hypothetical protein